MAKQPASLFDDLTSLSPAEVESKYEQARQALTELEEALVELHVKKKLHSETIKFAVNKLGEPPVEPATERMNSSAWPLSKSMLLIGHEERDDLVNRLVVPSHRVANTMARIPCQTDRPRRRQHLNESGARNGDVFTVLRTPSDAHHLQRADQVHALNLRTAQD